MTIPVYINNFNWLTSTKAMAEWFSCIRGIEPIIIDNASTYEPLLDWYTNKSECPYKIIRLDANHGHHAPWDLSCVLWGHTHRAMFGSDYYAVTDPDLDFAGVPWDLFDVCIDGLRQSPGAVKAGVALRIDDIPEHSRAKVHQCEGGYWTNAFSEQFFHALIDTTFAVYRCSTMHADAKGIGPALRTRSPYVARHLPWYWRNEDLNEEQRYYFAHANQSNSWKPASGPVVP